MKNKMDTKRGVVIIAAGMPYYTHMAANLAMSIRYHSDIPIILYTQGVGLNYLHEDQKSLFSEIKDLPVETYTLNGSIQYVKPKVHLYDLSPFKETIFLDADTIFSPFKRIEDLFSEQENEIQFACRGEKSMDESIRSEWVKLKDIEELYGFKHWYELSSEVIYFKQGKKSQKVFELAKYYYANHKLNIRRWITDARGVKLENKEMGITEFAGGIPDEVPFSLALEEAKVKIKAPYVPSYWQPQWFNKIKPDVKVQQDHYLISAGGSLVQPNIKRIYENLTKHYKRVGGHRFHPYQLIPKQRIIPERKMI